jgi:hypothetical protein
MRTTKIRLLIALVIGLGAGSFCAYLMTHLRIGAGDFTWAIEAARDLLARRNPYDNPKQLYPLPAALFGLPFVLMKPEIAAGFFYGISSALLAFCITRAGYHYLLIFFSYPYWAGILTAQWIPLIMAGTFFWWLSPAWMAKPQIGLPAALTSLNRKNAVLCAIGALISLAVMPHWIPLWLGQIGRYSRFIPLLVLPGPLLALAFLRFRSADARLLFFSACMPQRWFYDAFILWLIPKTRREIIFTAGLSWIPGIWRWFHPPHTFTEVGRWIVLWMYLPMLVVVLLRKSPTAPTNAEVNP